MMSEAVSGPVYAQPDVEKSLGVQPPAVSNEPNKVDAKEHDTDDADSSERADETPEKETEGSLRDYFVSNL